MKYLKKPVMVEAVQIASVEPEIGMTIKRETFPHWLEEALHQRDIREVAGWVLIDTPEGTVAAKSGDWIIWGVEGELYPCKNSVFEATYERVEDDK